MSERKRLPSRLIVQKSLIPTGKRSRYSFTMIELLVVISIIIVVTSISVAVLPSFLKDEGLKHSAQLVRGVFAKVRQLASSERVTHFILFAPPKGMMTIYRDADEDGLLVENKDEQIDESIVLAKGIIFVSGSKGPPLFRLPKPYISFRSDGSIMLPPDVADMTLANPPQEDSTDIVLREKNRASRIYLDFEEPSGLIRRIVYREK